MSISERLYIRWPPEAASEPTSTLVLTMPRTRKFVDLRLLLPLPQPQPQRLSHPQPPAALEWGFAGRAVGTPTRGKWVHEISSRTAHPEEEVVDEGATGPHPTMGPGVVLERGWMRRPAGYSGSGGDGVECEYEEAWRAVRVRGCERGERVAVLVEMRAGAEAGGAGAVRRGAIVRVGQVCQGIVRDGADVYVQRWEWADGEWTQTARIGAYDMPCDATWGEVREGDRIERGGVVWDVNELTLL
ncbi:hypothetical protein BC628DRAFT_1330318 [Trametes gibbosa]|nr:hypothetical protein BC628DRAFT_1330318 [Trametes gibbosa]